LRERVGVRVIGMEPDDELCFDTSEVGEVAPQRVLSAELVAGEAAVA